VLAEDEQGGLVSLAPPRDFYNTDRDFARYGPIRLGRLASAALSVLTIWVTCLAGRAATGRADTGLLAALLVGTLPQFTFRGMNVSNDALVALLSAATTLGCVRLVREGFMWRRAIWTAVALGFAYLSKINALANRRGDEAASTSPPTGKRRASSVCASSGWRTARRSRWRSTCARLAPGAGASRTSGSTHSTTRRRRRSARGCASTPGGCGQRRDEPATSTGQGFLKARISSPRRM
jgi:Dolichyl-phosphate-mannose-protein mannosyltransferase